MNMCTSVLREGERERARENERERARERENERGSERERENERDRARERVHMNMCTRAARLHFYTVVGRES